MQYQLVVIPYRDAFFRNRYGPVVRDVMFLEALFRDPRIARGLVLNRPTLITELALGHRKCSERHWPGSVHTFNRYSVSLSAHFYPRLWTCGAYQRYYKQVCDWLVGGLPTIILDFSPFGEMDGICELGFYWYDLIDNFTKHHRFTPSELEKVSAKYDFVSEHADLITGVTEKALDYFENQEWTECVPNGLLFDQRQVWESSTTHSEAYDFGFLGFVTEKLDVELIKRLADSGASIGIWGRVLDGAVEKRLAKIPRVATFGAFSDDDLDDIAKSFKIGLIAYREALLHDGSPLKLYQYLMLGKPVYSNVKFAEVDSIPIVQKYVLQDKNVERAMEFLEMYNKIKNPKSYGDEIIACVPNSVFVENKTKELLNKIDGFYEARK